MKKTLPALLLFTSVSGISEAVAGNGLPSVGETIHGFTVKETYCSRCYLRCPYPRLLRKNCPREGST